MRCSPLSSPSGHGRSVAPAAARAPPPPRREAFRSGGAGQHLSSAPRAYASVPRMRRSPQKGRDRTRELRYATGMKDVRGPFARLFCVSALTLAFVASAAASEPPQPGGSEVLNFSLLDYHGRHYELRRVDAKLLVLFFTGPDCPIARQNVPKLQAISDQLTPKGVVVWQINTMPQNDPDDRKLDAMFALGRVAPRDRMGDRYVVQGMRGLVSDAVLGDIETLRAETREHVWGSPPMPPVLRDGQQLVSRYFGVSRTCDTVVIDTKAMKVVYRGALDDQFSEGA